jgi:hypothetical protein
VTTPKLSRSRTAQRQNSSAWERLDHNRACLSAHASPSSGENRDSSSSQISLYAG